MEEIKRLLWTGSYKDCEVRCKEKLNENSEYYLLWYYLFLAENKCFTEPMEYLQDEIAYRKAIDLCKIEEDKSMMEETFTIINELRNVPNLPHLYFSIRNDKKEETLDGLSDCMNDTHVTNVDFSSEFISTVMDVLSLDSSKHMLYMMFFYLVSSHCNNPRFKKIFDRENKTENITNETIRKYILEERTPRERTTQSKSGISGIDVKLADLKEDVKDTVRDLNNYRRQMVADIKKQINYYKNKK